MTERLPALLEKAALDAGYDVLRAETDGWTAASISGQPARVLIKPFGADVLLLLDDSGLLKRLGFRIAELPGKERSGAAGLLDGPASLYAALRQLQVLQVRPIARLTAELEARLAAIPETERTQEVRKRIGQDVFREALFELWDGKCALSGVALPPGLLRASHAKPWAVAEAAERLDPFNGFLLAVHYDALFDKGLISFNEAGQVLIHPDLSPEAKHALQLEPGMRLRGLVPGHLPYLAHHREHVAKVHHWS